MQLKNIILSLRKPPKKKNNDVIWWLICGAFNYMFCEFNLWQKIEMMGVDDQQPYGTAYGSSVFF